MNLQLVKNKEKWQAFVKSNKAGLLESWQWGGFQKSLGKSVYPIALMEKGEILLTALIIKKALVFGKSYFYIPRGPIFKNSLTNKRKNNIFAKFVLEINKNFKKDKPIFLKVEPFDKNIFNNLDYSFLKVKPNQPKKTTILNLDQDLNDILSNMHSKTRYNIRLAERKGVKTYKAKDLKDINVFLKLLRATTQREDFKGYNDSYYKKLLKQENVDLYIADFKEFPIAAHIVAYFNDGCFYLHGASSRRHKKVMAPHRLHWNIIKDAKEKGFKYYDFWGIDETKWPGLTRFKRSFGSQDKTYPGTFDIIFNSFWYFLYKIAKKIKS
ncbi:MAG TPA: peptidoglycan bridge formation glycyltransferase FemA/FemB family protein [Patescibacteria group bacterium]|nr:peptidoglycan bridge formation glycyltransferase FemA/FemB family protein [Patescibacteria group bacterium]